MSDFSTFEPEEEFHRLLDEAIARGKALVARNADDAELQFVIGASHFYKGFHHARKKEYIKAFGSLARAKPWLEDAVRIDSTYYDAYLGLGILEYLAVKVRDYIVPFIGGDYKESLRKIALATKGKFTGVIAEEAMVVALAGASQWDEAVKLAHYLIEIYPTNRLFYWALIEILKRKEDFGAMLGVAYDLLRLIEEDQPTHYYNQSLVRSYCAEAYVELGQYRECIRECDRALSLLEGENRDERSRELEAQIVRVKRQAAKALAVKVDR